MVNTIELPGIIQQRWAAACESPNIPRWRSLAQWCENFADLCAAHPETAHLAGPAREMADEAYSNMVALQPVREAA